MKKIALFTFLALFVFSGTALAADLAGYWKSYVWCDSPIYGPSYEVSCALIEYENGSDKFYTSSGVYPIGGEECWGVVKRKRIYHACQNTVFHGRMRGKNKIVGFNYVIPDQKSCYIETYRDPEECQLPESE